jgi:hypothetical protein
MPNGLVILVWVLVGAAVVLVLFRAVIGLREYWQMRGKRLVTCPETKQPAAVDVDARQAGWKAALHAPELRLTDCSRWPERHDCGQQCLRQIESAPMDCLVRRIVVKWYEGKTCVYCHKPVDNVEEWVGHTPALLAPDQKTVYWDHIKAEKLPEVFKTYQPVCWSCHIAETFRREHPDLVIDRPARW